MYETKILKDFSIVLTQRQQHDHSHNSASLRLGLSFTIMVMVICMIMTFSYITIVKSQQIPFSVRKIGVSVCRVLEFL